MLTYTEFIDQINNRRVFERHQRYGQLMMNELYYCRPDLYERVTMELEPHITPFYRDQDVPTFVKWLEENWESNGTPTL